MQQHRCRVISLEPYNESTYYVRLQPETPVEFLAGQYLKIVLNESDKRPFSIANAPRKDGAIELQIGAPAGNHYAREVLEIMQRDGSVLTEIGCGDAYLRKSEKPILLVAGGSGFAYCRAILLQLMAPPYPGKIVLYWGAHNPNLFYDLEAIEQIKHLPHFEFIPVVEHANSTWQGAQGNVIEALFHSNHDLAQFDIYVAGRFEMAAALRDELQRRDIQTALYGDAFAFI